MIDKMKVDQMLLLFRPCLPIPHGYNILETVDSLWTYPIVIAMPCVFMRNLFSVLQTFAVCTIYESYPAHNTSKFLRFEEKEDDISHTSSPTPTKP